MEPKSRYEACHLLRADGIPSVCWFEDAIATYGVPTVVFDLYLLVRDIDTAAEVLFRHGWVSAPDQPSDTFHFLSEKSAKPHRRLALPAPPRESSGPAPTRTFLLAAADWNFPSHYLVPSISHNFIPPLPALVDALIGSLLDAAEDTELFSHLQMQVGYLYGHVPELKVMGFADNLKYEHRQFHLDSLSGMFIMSLPFIAHERQIREELREGKFQLRECSVSRRPSADVLFSGMRL